ncbi:glutathione synthetase-like isoform X1 [Oculina patagonica]
MAQPLYVGHEVSQDEVNYLEKEGRDYCLAHGMVYKDSKGDSQHIPFTLFPSPFPQKLFNAAKGVQADFNLLVHKVSQDYEFTKNALSSTVAADPFTSRLFDIYGKVLEQGNAQPISLGIFRSDYLIDTSGGLHNQCCGCNSSDKNAAGPIYIKQVEMNTIALGGISFSCLVPSMHRYLLHLKGQENKVPANPALDEAADGLIRAWELYGSKSAVIMFVVQPGEVNVYDQRLLEYRIHERNGGIKVIRRSLNDIFNDGKTDNEKSLFVNGLEVAVAYFRAGYTPKDYPTENEWSARLTLELSRCIKCPTVAHQLMGTKKIQQVLAEPGVLERFLPDKESVARVRRTFTGLYTLDPGPEGDHNMECCLQMVEKCVLKPQREGGGNNIYGEDIRGTLLNNSVNRTQYILMDRIQPEINKNYIVRQEYTSICPVDVIPELGIVGIFISRGDEVLVNKEGGYLVRTKTTEHADGGVFAGRAAFDSAYMV